MSAVAYADVLAVVGAGAIVACTPIRRPDGSPDVVWLAVELDEQGTEIARTGDGEPKVPESGIDDADEVRAAQIIGYALLLHRHARRIGLTPA